MSDNDNVAQSDEVIGKGSAEIDGVAFNFEGDKTLVSDILAALTAGTILINFEKIKNSDNILELARETGAALVLLEEPEIPAE
jgi:hypothetical protein